MTAQILVVDDEPDLEGLLVQKFRHQIREGKVEFLFARDGVEALAMLEANRDVDMVVTDINMPRMDGLLLLQKLQGGGTVDPVARGVNEDQILAALEAEHNLFASEQTIEEAWRIVDPVLDPEHQPIVYERDTWGPAEADALTPNHHWFTPHVKGADLSHPADKQ